MPDADSTRLLPDPKTAAIRCYGQGLGDCFLLAFPRASQPSDPFYVVIDCGVARGTPNEAARMQQVVKDIYDATAGRLDILAVTHQHYDHVIGFVHAEDLWKTFQIDKLFLPWTEKPGDEDAATIGKVSFRLGEAVNQGVQRLSGLPASAGPAMAAQVDDSFAAGNESFGIGPAECIKQGWKNAKDLCPPEHHVYCEPGDVHLLADTGVRAYVLGPPRLTDQQGAPLVGRTGKALVYLLEDAREMYSYEQFGLMPDGSGHSTDFQLNASPGDYSSLATALLGSGPTDDEDYDRYCPFDSAFRVDWDEALTTPFLWEHYSGGADWRRIDYDWLDGTPALALRAGGITNNISLVLAFELPESKDVLLFVGDAQVGNWLSWQRIHQWRPTDPAQPTIEAKIDHLLSRVVFYKVGHHGSHNATIRQNGLEKMRDGLTAFIPVSVPVAHDIMGYCPMPFYPVLLALQQKTGGRVFLANGELLEPLPAGADPDKLKRNVTCSANQLAEKVRSSSAGAPSHLEDAVPLWTQFTLEDQRPATATV